MEHKLENLQAGLLVGFTCLLAAAMCVNAVQALAGKASFAYWHLVTLVCCMSLTDSAVSWVTLARWAISLRTLKRKAGTVLKHAFTSISGAVCSLAAPFIRQINHVIRLQAHRRIGGQTGRC